MKLVLSVFVTTSLFAQCSSVTEDFPLRFTDDFFPEPECDVDRPCADPNECCSFQGTCGADRLSCGIECVAGPCKIFCGYPDNLCNPNECCSITFECGVGEDCKKDLLIRQSVVTLDQVH